MQSKNALHNKHTDANFTFAIKREMCDTVSLFVSDNVFVLLFDDKQMYVLTLLLLQNKLHS